MSKVNQQHIPTPALLLTSSSEADTVRIGQAIGHCIRIGDVIFLSGDLGAGKTRMVHGMADAIQSPVSARSPTFVIVNEYPGRIHINHCDLYRLGSPEEVEDLALEERLMNGALVVEWPEIGHSVLPDDFLYLRFENGSDENERRITFTANGPRSANLLSRSAAVYESLDAAVDLHKSQTI